MSRVDYPTSQRGHINHGVGIVGADLRVRVVVRAVVIIEACCLCCVNASTRALLFDALQWDAAPDYRRYSDQLVEPHAAHMEGSPVRHAANAASGPHDAGTVY